MGEKKALIYALPTSAEVNGKTYQIESDYRAVLDILAALSDKDLTEEERAIAALEIFYPDFDDIPLSEAIFHRLIRNTDPFIKVFGLGRLEPVRLRLCVSGFVKHKVFVG
jgi:hypothetical protein